MTGLGRRLPDGTLDGEHPERRRRVERGPLATLRGLEVAQLLARQRRDDDAPDAHRAGPGECLGIDPGAHDQDAAGTPDVDPARTQLAERVGRQLQPATGGHAGRERAAQREARRPNPDLAAGPDRNHETGERRSQAVALVAGRDAPPVAMTRDG